MHTPEWRNPPTLAAHGGTRSSQEMFDAAAKVI